MKTIKFERSYLFTTVPFWVSKGELFRKLYMCYEMKQASYLTTESQHLYSYALTSQHHQNQWKTRYSN